MRTEFQFVTIDIVYSKTDKAAQVSIDGGQAYAPAITRFLKMGTIDLRVDYLRPGLGRHFVASAEPTRLGGRIGSTQMRLVNDEGSLIATAAAAYVAARAAHRAAF